MEKKKDSFVSHRAYYRLPTSVVGIVETPKETRLEIRYGWHDQPVAEKIYQLYKSSSSYWFEPGTESFNLVCDYVNQLRWPTAYQKDKAGVLEGLIADPDSLSAVLRTAGKDSAMVVLENAEMQDPSLYHGIDVVFKKEKNEAPPKLP